MAEESVPFDTAGLSFTIEEPLISMNVPVIRNTRVVKVRNAKTQEVLSEIKTGTYNETLALVTYLSLIAEKGSKRELTLTLARAGASGVNTLTIYDGQDRVTQIRELTLMDRATSVVDLKEIFEKVAKASREIAIAKENAKKITNKSPDEVSPNVPCLPVTLKKENEAAKNESSRILPRENQTSGSTVKPLGAGDVKK